MSQDDTPNLKLPYIMAAQAQKHVTHNEAIRALDALVQLSVLDRDLAAPPGSPADGARYVIGGSPTGVWAGHAGKVAAFQDGEWEIYTPREGWVAWIADEEVLVAWNGSAWVTAGGGGGVSLNPATGGLVGVNTTADATNKLAVKSDAVLFSHDDVTPGTGDIRVVYNKSTASGTASFLFQTAYSGRAEVGTTGDDKLRIKVSADGSAWTERAAFTPVGIGVGTDTPEGLLHVKGPLANSWTEYTSTDQGAGGGFALRGPSSLGDQAMTAFYHGNVNAGATQGFMQIAQLNYQGAYMGTLAAYYYHIHQWGFFTGGTQRLILTADGTLAPAADNAQSLGASWSRWGSIWAANGVIQTSDARDKADVARIPAARAGALVDAIEPVTFRWLVGGREVVGRDAAIGAPETKDVPGKRRHAGFLAQEVKAALDRAGIECGAWGLEDKEDIGSRQWVRPDQLLPLMWAALKETRARVEFLERRAAI